MDGDEGVTQLENLNLTRDEKFMESVSIEVSTAFFCVRLKMLMKNILSNL